MPLHKAVAIGALSFAMTSLFGITAHAEWRFHPEHCPDFFEHHNSAIEVDPDEPVAVCPTVAWTWQSDHHHRPTHPRPTAIYHHSGENYYYHRGPHGELIRIHVP